MDEPTMIGQQMDDTEQIHAWQGEDISWAQPTGQWVSRRHPWRKHLKNTATYALVPAGIALAVLFHNTMEQHAANLGTHAVKAPRIVTVTPTAPPVPHPGQSPADPYYTQSVSREEFLDSLRRNQLPTPSDAVKEANDICRLLDGGMPFRAVMINTSANHPDWNMGDAGGFTGAATGFCPKYRP